MEDLVEETIFIHGMNVLYIPRKYVKLDDLFGEDTLSEFDRSYPIEMYFDSASGWDGDKSILSKLGVQIKKQAHFVVSRRRFNETMKRIGAFNLPAENVDSQEVRPLEGDLIYIPMTKDLWEIQFVDHEAVFYQLGKNYIWRISVEKFVYSNQPINTGVPEVDRIADQFKNEDSPANDPFSKNDVFEDRKNDIIDFSEDNPFGTP